MRYVLDELIGALEREETVIMAGIVRSSGSAPRTSGARMLMLADGRLIGSIGGGAVEGTCHAEARKLLADSHTYAIHDFQLSISATADKGMVCGGAVSVLLQKIEPAELRKFQQLRRAFRQGECPSLLTIFPHDGAPPRVLTFGAGANEELSADLQQALAIRDGRSSYMISHGGKKIFVEPLIPPVTVYLVGGGHVALATGHLAVYAGFDIVVIDDRHEFANIERFPKAREVRVCENFNTCFNGLGPEDYVVIVTRDHLHDRHVLGQALRTEAGYIGMIGSSRKRKAVYDYLLSEGFDESDLRRVHSPIGLSIGADSPEEIGVSIVAELISIRAEMRR
jgi:xanthine dehydrogenase accessory factor